MISSDVKSRMFFFKKKNGGTDFLFQEKVLYRIYLTCSKLEYFVICFFFFLKYVFSGISATTTEI